MDINKTTLKNGVRILTRKMPYVRSVSMGVWVNAGARDETPDESGLSHFIEHMIFKGTKKRTAFQIAKEFDAIGGQTNAFTSKENTCYYARVMYTHLDTMVDILSDIFLNSAFNVEEMERERQVIFQEIGMVEDSPEEFIHLLSDRTYWGDDPLGRSILGSRENVLRFSPEILKSFFNKFYQPERILISMSGNVSHDRFVDIVGPLFESIPRGNGFPERITPLGQAGIAVKHRDLEQAHVSLITRGISITDPRRYAFSLMNTIMGGNMSSRLFQEIRERKGLAYSVFTFISSFTDTGIFGAYAGVDPEKIDETVGLILKEMRNFREKRVDSAELRDAKEYTKGSILLASESVDNQMVRLAQNEFHFGKTISLESVVAKIEAITEDDILALAVDMFQSNQLSMAALGPIDDKKRFENILSL